MKKLITIKPLLCLLMAGTTITSISLLEGCSSRQDRYQELVAVANRNFNRLNYETAEEYYLKCIEILPKREEPYISLLEIYDQTTQPEKAYEVLELAKENLSKESYELVEHEARELGQVTEEAEDEEGSKIRQEAEAKPLDPKMLEAYKNALRVILNENLLPDGTKLIPRDDPLITYVRPDIFAIADVNGNGIQDLLFQHIDTYSYAQCGYIGEFDPESGGIKTLYYGSYDFIPYTGNVLRTNSPKNQSPVREVWPFQLHTWNESSGEFELYMNVSGTYTDASEKREIDKDKDGLVLNISHPDPVTDSGTTQYDSEFMDKADLEAEVAGLAGDIRPIPVKYTDLTGETLNAFGQEMEQEENGPDFSVISFNNLGLKSHDPDELPLPGY